MPLSSEQVIPATVHGRYLLRVPVGEGPFPLIVGFHGYAQNAEMNLENLAGIPGADEAALCSIQALYPFYNMKTGEVVTSWMTSLNRDLALNDNIRYVADAVSQAKARAPVGDRLVYVGFSQGAAMAHRAAFAAGHRCDGLVILAGDVPPDVALQDLSHYPPVLIVRGDRDIFYPEEQMDKDVAALEGRGIAVETVTFQGGHEWSDVFYETAGKFLSRVLSG